MTLLDLPATAILQLSQEASEARYLLTAGLQEATGRNPSELTDEFTRAAVNGGSVRDVLTAMQAPTAAAESVRMLERSRDELRSHAEAKRRELDAAATADTLDDFSAAQALVDPVIREQRWLRAQRQGLAPTREQWEQIDRPALEVGRDQLADAAIAGAQRELTASVKILDQALAEGRREGVRTGRGMRELDRAIGSARSERISLAATPSPNVRMLVTDTPLDRAQRVLAAEGKDCTDGRLLLDAMVALDTDGGEKQDAVAIKPGIDVTADRAHRLEQARLIAGRFDGVQGEQRFYEQDRAAAGRGIDLVATLRKERDRSVREGTLPPGGRV